MKRLFIILALTAFSFALTACGTSQKVVQKETQNKSVETKYERIYVRDTVMLEIPTDKEIIYRDSIVYVDKEVEVPVMVEKDLTAWQEFRLKWFNVLVIVSLCLMIWAFRTPLKNLIRRFI